jgi:hypothetical protein
MASSRQVVGIVDEIFDLDGTGRYHAEFLRAAGVLPSTPGRPEPLAPEHIALLLVSVLLGEPCASHTPERVLDYAKMRPGAGGPSFGDVLAKFITDPHDCFQVRVDLNSPGAVLTFRQADRGMATVMFESEARHTAGIERYATIDGGTLTKLSAAIANAPEVKAGRRRRNRKLT